MAARPHIFSGPGRPRRRTPARTMDARLLFLFLLALCFLGGGLGDARAPPSRSLQSSFSSGPPSVTRVTASPSVCGPSLNTSVLWPLYYNSTCFSSAAGTLLTISGDFSSLEEQGIVIRVEVLSSKRDVIIGSSLCKVPAAEASILQSNAVLACETATTLPVGPARLNITQGAESLRADGLLSLCEAGQYPQAEQPSSSASSFSELFCAPCPNGAACLGGLEEPTAQPGYWPTEPSQWQARGINVFSFPGPYLVPPSSPSSLALTAIPPFVSCPLAPACLPAGVCYSGYDQESWACTDCQTGWAKRGTGVCAPCPSPRVSAFVLIGAALGAIIFLVYLITAAMQRRSKLTILARLLINYMQQTAICRGFAAFSSAPAEIQSGLSMANAANVVSFDVQALNCAFNATFYTRLGLYIALPIISACVPWIVLKSYSSAKIKSRWLGCRPLRERKVNRTAFTATLVLFFFFHQQVCQAILSVFSCASVVAGGYLRADPSVSCFTETHRVVQNAVAPIFLVLFGLGIPLLSFYTLHRHRKVLASRRSLKYLGSLYDGTRKGVATWYEPSIMIRKLAFLLLGAIIVDQTLQLLAAQLLISIVLGAQLYARPYEERLLNGLEAFSLLGNLTLYFGLLTYQIAASSGFAVLQTVMIYAILIVNGAVIVAFAVSFFLAVRQQAVIAAREAQALAMRGLTGAQGEEGGKGFGMGKGGGASAGGAGKASWMAALFGFGATATPSSSMVVAGDPTSGSPSFTRNTMAFLANKTRQASNIVRFMVMGAGANRGGGSGGANSGGMIGASGIVGVSGRGGSSVPAWGSSRRAASNGGGVSGGNSSSRRRGTTRVGTALVNDYDDDGQLVLPPQEEFEGPSPQMVTRTLQKSSGPAVPGSQQAGGPAMAGSTKPLGVKRAQRQIRHSRLVVAHERLQQQQRRLLTLVVPRSEVERARLLAVEAQLESSSAAGATGASSAAAAAGNTASGPATSGAPGLRAATMASNAFAAASGGRTSPSTATKRGSTAMTALRRISEHFLGATGAGGGSDGKRASAISTSAGLRKGSILHLQQTQAITTTTNPLSSSASTGGEERWSRPSGLTELSLPSRWSDRSLLQSGEDEGAVGAGTSRRASTIVSSLDESILDEKGQLRKSARLGTPPPPPPPRPLSSSSLDFSRSRSPPMRAEVNHSQNASGLLLHDDDREDELWFDDDDDGYQHGGSGDDGADDVFAASSTVRRQSLGKELAELFSTASSGIRRRRPEGAAGASGSSPQQDAQRQQPKQRASQLLLVPDAAEKIAKQRQRALIAAKLVGDTTKKGIRRMFQAAGGHTFVSKLSGKVLRSIGIQADLNNDNDAEGVLAAFAADGKLALATPGPAFGASYGESESDTESDEEVDSDDDEGEGRDRVIGVGNAGGRKKRMTAASDSTAYSAATTLYSGAIEREDPYSAWPPAATGVVGGGNSGAGGGGRQIFSATSFRDFMSLVRAARRTSGETATTGTGSSSNRRSLSMGPLRASAVNQRPSNSAHGMRTSSLVFEPTLDAISSSSAGGASSSPSLRISSSVGRDRSEGGIPGSAGIELPALRNSSAAVATSPMSLASVNQRGLRVFLLKSESQRSLDAGPSSSAAAEEPPGAPSAAAPLASPSPAALMSVIKDATASPSTAPNKRSSVRFLDVLESAVATAAEAKAASQRRLALPNEESVAVDILGKSPPILAVAASSHEDDEDEGDEASGARHRRSHRPTRKFTHPALASPLSDLPMDVLSRARSRASTVAVPPVDASARMSVSSINRAAMGTDRLSANLRPLSSEAGKINPLASLGLHRQEAASSPPPKKKVGWLNLGRLFGGGSSKASNEKDNERRSSRRGSKRGSNVMSGEQGPAGLRTVSIPLVVENPSSARSALSAAMTSAAPSSDMAALPAPAAPSTSLTSALRRQTSMPRGSARRLTNALPAIAEEGSASFARPLRPSIAEAPALRLAGGLRRRSVMLFGPSEVVGKFLEGSAAAEDGKASEAGDANGAEEGLVRRGSLPPPAMAPVQPRRPDRRRSSLATAPLCLQADGSLGINLLAGGKRASTVAVERLGGGDDGMSLGLLPFNVVATDGKGLDDSLLIASDDGGDDEENDEDADQSGDADADGDDGGLEG